MAINLKLLSKSRVLIVGDVMLDRYLWGEVVRISPEAPVPVVRSMETSEVLGGAGNVAANLSGLGCQAAVIGICGGDDAGRRLTAIFDEKNIGNYLITDNERPTITKTRVMASGQQLFRLDEEEPNEIKDVLSKNLFSALKSNIKKFNVVILSDYGKGIFKTPGLCRRIIAFCNSNNVPVLVDPKDTDWDRYKGATCITPNTAELAMVAGQDVKLAEQMLIKASESIIKEQELQWLLVTRGAEGMCLFGKDKPLKIIPARAREVFDVSGAGDTVIATLAAGLSAGYSFSEAAEVANVAAGIVVGKLGTQPISYSELETACKISGADVSVHPVKVMALDAAKIQVRSWRTSGDKIIFTNGCYDLLHPGHIDLLHKSKALGNRLVVGLNTDASVRRLKGESRPILSEQDRAAVLSALSCVDMVVLFDEDTPLNLISALTPDTLVKGADYRPDQVVGKEVVEAYGGKIELVPLLEGYSTTGITAKIIASHNNG
ncbi:MAG: bifunctional D-glycero-beta-D-manno-heptose-7-phosphate kinase/D-glycero-beta-D-manno-heptose 1-phosphate adenylyltransferase HldE [Desulfobacterales bacterium]|nr:bifunctional D-glycero-beta-D-manno-heptose-7-phosphate kinase/D-glycero-beta-D-manno-heptose 1-phosphate adenylyltransferase HldE [Desulfobacterales bacterium]